MGDRESVERDGSQEDLDGSEATDGSGNVCKGGVPLKTERSPEDCVKEEDLDNKSPSLSLSSNPTPGSVTQPDRGGCEGRGKAEAGSIGFEGKAESLPDCGAVAACWESDADKGQDEEEGSCRQVEGSAVSHRGEEEEEEEEVEGRTEGRSPVDIGCVVCKRTPPNPTEVVVDEK